MRDGQVDLSSPGFKRDPFPFYASLRADSPVHRVVLPNRQTAWLVTRYDDAVAALKDARLGAAAVCRRGR